MSLLKNINYIKELDRIPCADPSPWIIVKTAAQAAPPALLSLLVPGCTDIVKTRLGRSPWHAKSISSFIKKAVGPEALGANKFLYKVGYDAAERFLWYWMLADVTQEFFVTWQSQIFQEQQCELPGAGTAHGYYEPFVYDGHIEVRLIPGIITHPPGVTIGSHSIAILPGYQGTFAYECEWESYPVAGGSVNVTTWLQVDDEQPKLDYATTNSPGQGNYNRTGGSIWHNRPGTVRATEYSVHAQIDTDFGDHVRLVRSTWYVGLQGRHEGNLSWGCKPKPVSWPFPG